MDVENKNTLDEEIERLKNETKKMPFPEDIDFEFENGIEDTGNDKLVETGSHAIVDLINEAEQQETNEEKIFRELEKTATDLKLHEQLERAEAKKPKKKKKETLMIVLCVLLVVSIGLLGLSMYAYKNRETIKKEAKPTIVPIIDSSGSSTTAQLPTELTDLNSYQLFVNSVYTLDSTYVPSDLATPYLNSTADVIQVRNEAGEMAKQMKAAAESEGVPIYVTSGYMSYEEIATKAQDITTLNGEEYAKANGYIAGANEHQTGLALDFSDTATGENSSSTSFKDTATSQWLVAHAHEYGFILRYPEGKESITGINYTPWHYRYVGVDVANAIYNRGAEINDPNYTFEEYYSLVD